MSCGTLACGFLATPHSETLQPQRYGTGTEQLQSYRYPESPGGVSGHTLKSACWWLVPLLSLPRSFILPESVLRPVLVYGCVPHLSEIFGWRTAWVPAAQFSRGCSRWYRR